METPLHKLYKAITSTIILFSDPEIHKFIILEEMSLIYYLRTEKKTTMDALAKLLRDIGLDNCQETDGVGFL
jgi:hypothetical protein